MMWGRRQPCLERRLAQPASRRILPIATGGRSPRHQTDGVEQAPWVATPKKLAEVLQRIGQSLSEIFRIGLQPAGKLGRFVAVTTLSAAAICAAGSECSKLLSWQGEGEADHLGVATAKLVEHEVENVACLVTTTRGGGSIVGFDNRLEEAVAEHSVLLIDRGEQRLFGTWLVRGKAIGQGGGVIRVHRVVRLVERDRDVAHRQNRLQTMRVDPQVACCLVEREIPAVLPETVVCRDHSPVVVRDRHGRSNAARVGPKIPAQRDIEKALGLVSRIGLVGTVPGLKAAQEIDPDDHGLLEKIVLDVARWSKRRDDPPGNRLDVDVCIQRLSFVPG